MVLCGHAHRSVLDWLHAAAATGIKKPTDTRMPSGQTEKLINTIRHHLSPPKLSRLTSDVEELS
jgi:hypothetical protein